jgi:MFS family permease
MASKYTILPPLDRQIWILMIGRLLSQMGTGFILFSAPVFFVNHVGISAAAVGFGLGSESITGVFGRIIGGSMCDSPRWGRRKTLMLAVTFAAIADWVLAISNNFPMFLTGNLLMGMGVGLYWPSAETMVADLAPIAHRNEAFALNRLADSVGLSLGIVVAGAWIAATGNYRALFLVDSLSFLVFLMVVYGALQETRPLQSADAAPRPFQQAWRMALGDRALRIFVLVNVLFTTYLALVSSTLPLYFTNFVSDPDTANEFTANILSALFAGYVALVALLQLPVARWLNRYSNPQAMSVSALLWGVGFFLMWVTGTTLNQPMTWAALSLAVMALATVSYTPAASSLVTGLAPEALRGVYLSVNSLCWAGGYFIGPAMGGWAMDHSPAIAHTFWLGVGLTVFLALLILQVLGQALARNSPQRL